MFAFGIKSLAVWLNKAAFILNFFQTVYGAVYRLWPSLLQPTMLNFSQTR